MLTGYFDDSGTHGGSDVVIVAGVLGTEWQIRSLDALWRETLQLLPSLGKMSIRRFHMSNCHNSDGEFLGWSRTETDYLVSCLCKAIINSHVAAYGVAVSRAEWDAQIIGDLKSTLGNAEGHCIRNCFVNAMFWARNCTFDPQICIIFDDRPSTIKRDATAVFHAFHVESASPRFTECLFCNSETHIPLQAADLIAWEFYQHAKEVYNSGETESFPKRPSFGRIVKQVPNRFQIASRDVINEIKGYWLSQNADHVRQLADHFENFEAEKHFPIAKL